MLSVVPTPIGNLGDITVRAVETLKQSDFIVCEDTRRTLSLLKAYEIEKPMMSFHEHSGKGRVYEIIALLKEGKRLALVTDGGMPVVSDPGFEIIHAVIAEKIPFEVLPGASSVDTALVASGLPSDSFSFFGFVPAKAAQKKKLFSGLKNREETLIFFESPFRILKTLEAMAEVFGDREAAVTRTESSPAPLTATAKSAWAIPVKSGFSSMAACSTKILTSVSPPPTGTAALRIVP